MPNPGQPTITPGATGDAVRRLQRALRRTPNLGVTLTGTFGPKTETAVKEFQQGAGLVVDGIVGPQTWAALPDGGPMPTLREGSNGDAVRGLQQVLTNGAPGQWNTTPSAVDGSFGPHTKASVMATEMGRRTFGRCSRGSDLGGVTACGERNPGECSRAPIRCLLCPQTDDAAAGTIKLVLGRSIGQCLTFLRSKQPVDAM